MSRVSRAAHTVFKVVSYNIDTNFIRAEQGYARESHPEWRSAARMPRILGQLDKAGDDVDFFCLQELRKCNTRYDDLVDSVTPIQSHLEGKGYETVITPAQPGEDMAFKLLTAFNPDRFTFVGEKPLYFTRSPEESTNSLRASGATKEAIEYHNFGLEWERMADVIDLICTETDQKITVINVHPRVHLQSRIESSKILVAKIQEKLTADPDTKIIMLGDFNSLPDLIKDEAGQHQLRILEEATFNGESLLTDVSKTLLLDNGTSEAIPIDFTFFAFPYDFFHAQYKMLCDSGEIFALDDMDPEAKREKLIELWTKHGIAKGGHLDHIFVHGLTATHTTAFLDTDPMPESFDEATLKQYQLEYYVPRASDHLLITATLCDQQPLGEVRLDSISTINRRFLL